MSFNLTAFKQESDWEQQACNYISQTINDAIDRDGEARICLAGGSTPFPIYKKLAKEKIAWDKCVITLSDERVVETTCEQSNEGALKKDLLNKVNSHFVSLMDNRSTETNTGADSELALFINNGFHLVVLGMGNDGHIASLFPNTDATRDAFNLDRGKVLIRNTAPDEPKERLSLSPSMLTNSENILLLIKGQAKRQVLDKAQQANDVVSYPVSMLFKLEQPVLALWFDDCAKG